MKVYVNAWEYVNEGPDAGGGGFDWFHTSEAARAAYDAEVSKAAPDWAYFFFDFDADGLELDEITSRIDEQLFDLCATARVRHVGAEVARYWRLNKMNMGQH